MKNERIKMLQQRRTLFNTFLMVFFGLLSYLLGQVQFSIPGVEGGISDLREIVILVSCFYMPHWIYLIGISIITSLSTPPEGSIITSISMHVVASTFAWFAYNFIKKKKNSIYLKAFLWLLVAWAYYVIFLVPIFASTNFAFDLTEGKGIIDTYFLLLKILRFEIIITIFATLIYFVFVEVLRELREKITWLEIVIKSANVGLWRRDVSGKEIRYHEQWAQLLGYMEDEINFTHETWQNLLHPKDRERVIHYINNSIAAGKDYNLEYRLKSKSGAYKWMMDFGKRIPPDTIDNLIQYAGITIDISERKKIENELKLAKVKAEESDRLKSEFLAQMSHEIRTPVNTIMSFAELIYSEIGDIIPDDLKPALSSIQNSGNRLIRTVDLILNVSELNVGLYSKSDTKLDIYKILELIVYEFRHKEKESSVEIILEYTGTDFETKLDSYSVNQIFYNIIDNAIKYTPKGFVKIIISSQSSNILVDVEDSGIGISEDFLPRIFNPFEQEEQGYTRPYEGNGLGMTLVKKYCEINDIQISISSKQNVGTKISLIIPKVV